MKKTNLLAFSVSALALVAGASLVACGDDTTGVTTLPDGAASGTSGSSTGSTGATGSKSDGGPDATTDSGSTVVDAGPDATVTEGGSTPDSGDAASDATSDATSDAANDAASDAAVFPAPPTLGVEIDRFGRPAVNTALNHVFDNTATKGPAKDAYNANSDAGSWVAAYTSEFEKNLAILDALDTNSEAGTGCGTQAFAGPSADAGPARYGTLAAVLADDRLWIDTASTNCTQYLGVELVTTGVLTNPDGGTCGGRTPSEDVIMTTYSAVALGTLSGFGSGVTANGPKTTVTTFPYFQTISQ